MPLSNLVVQSPLDKRLMDKTYGASFGAGHANERSVPLVPKKSIQT